MQSKVVFLIGGSASGKWTVIRNLQQIGLDSGVLSDMRVAERTTTHKAFRAGAAPNDRDRYMDREAFYAATRNGTIDVHWKRTIALNQVQEYGLSLTRELDHHGLVLVSAHSSLDWTKQESLRNLRTEGRLMIVRLHASADTRLRRLNASDPKLSQEEVAARMAEPPGYLLPDPDFVILNDPPHDAYAAEKLLGHMTALRFFSLPFSGMLVARSFAARN
jgi:ribose 1,5-bisphosphokinase PhnN